MSGAGVVAGMPAAHGAWTLAAAPAAAALAGTTASAALCACWFMRRLGGCTGDTLGAAQQLGELAALLGWLAVAGGA
jgi:adenosylcobinamide-GDP ribazoletransferase